MSGARTLLLLLSCVGCTGLGDFPTPTCDAEPSLQRVDVPAALTTLTQRPLASSTAWVLQTAAGEPRLLAQLGRDGAWDQRALGSEPWCGGRQACKLSGLDLAQRDDQLVVAITSQAAAGSCNALRLALADRLLDPTLTGSAPGSLYAGVHLDEAGCTRGGVHDARVAALPKQAPGDVLLAWRSDEPVPASTPCAEQGEGYIAALGVSVPAGDYGLFSDESQSLRCLGVSKRAPSLLAIAGADGYLVGLLTPTALRVLFVPAFRGNGEQGGVAERASLPLAAADADGLVLSLTADEQQLAARWVAGGRAYLAVFALEGDATLHLRLRADVALEGTLLAETQLMRVDAGLLDWESYHVDAGWLLLWATGDPGAAELHAARISERTGKPLGASLELARGALGLPFTLSQVSGDVYGFVRRDEITATGGQAELAQYGTACVVAARL